MPGGSHGSHVVQHVALRLLHGAEVRNHLGGLHDHFAEKERAGADDISRHVHDADQCVHLGKVAAVGAEGLPDVGDRVEADDVHAVVAEVQHVGGHVIEDHRVRVVQVPLVGVEGGHDDLLRFLAPGEVSGRRGGEHLRHVFFVLVRQHPVVVEEETVLVFLFTGAGTFRPLMVLAGVVHDKVKTHRHPTVMAGIRQIRQVFHGAKLGLYFSEVGHCVSAVRAVLGALKERHQMDIVDSALLQIFKVLLDTLQRSGEAVGIEHHAQSRVVLAPFFGQEATVVPLLQFRFSRLIVIMQHVNEVIECLHVVAVDLTVQPFQFIIVLIEPCLKLGLIGFVFFHRHCLRFFYISAAVICGRFSAAAGRGKVLLFCCSFLTDDTCRSLRRSFFPACLRGPSFSAADADDTWDRRSLPAGRA